MTEIWVKRISAFLKGWVLSFAVAIIIAASFRSAIADWNDIPTGSMEPTILIGDRVFINKLAYDLKIPFTTWRIAEWSNPKRGDIVVFFSPEDGTRLIKRVVAIPGDTISMYMNHLIINGEFVEYKPLNEEIIDQIDRDIQTGHLFLSESIKGKKHQVMLTPSIISLNSFKPITIPDGKYFMMGDNRDNSKDSRFFGPVDRKLIVGQATNVVISRDESFLSPRWKRFFQKLM